MQPTPGQGALIARLLCPHLAWIVLSVVTGICAGAATVALLATVNQVLHRSAGMTGQMLLVYLGLCAAALAGRGVSDVSTNLVGQRIVAQLVST